jgi:bifunctional non-homologous end joining protein LigD
VLFPWAKASEMSRYFTPSLLDFIPPCLPCATMLPPSGMEWLHEIKHPGHRLIARRHEDGIRLFSGRGDDWTSSFPGVVEALGQLPVKSCIIDGELVRCNERGETRMDPVRAGISDAGASFYAFDVLEVNGFDLRRDRIEERKRALAQILRKPPLGIRLNEHFERCAEPMLRQIGRMGFEGVISKRRGSRYLSGRSPDWLFSRKLDDGPRPHAKAESIQVPH